VVILLDNQLNETKKIIFRKRSLGGITGIASQISCGYKPTNWPFDYIKNEYKTISTPSRKHKTLSN
jgi:hypothetical protein